MGISVVGETVKGDLQRVRFTSLHFKHMKRRFIKNLLRRRWVYEFGSLSVEEGEGRETRSWSYAHYRELRKVKKGWGDVWEITFGVKRVGLKDIIRRLSRRITINSYPRLRLKIQNFIDKQF